MDSEILLSYAKRELLKYGTLGGISLLLAFITKFTIISRYITTMTPIQVSNLLLILTMCAMTKYALILLDINLTDYVEVGVESVVELENCYGGVITQDNKTYYFDASKDKYKHLHPNQLSMVVTKRCRLPVMLISNKITK